MRACKGWCELKILKNVCIWSVSLLKANLRPPAPTTSCNHYCGKQQPDAGCWCDVLCNGEGDCCPDYNQTCCKVFNCWRMHAITLPWFPSPPPPPPVPPSPPFSCINSCGAQHYSKMCWCDSACQLKMDCCQDYATVCGGGGSSLIIRTSYTCIHECTFFHTHMHSSNCPSSLLCNILWAATSKFHLLVW